MGAYCPIDKTWQAVVKNVTADGDAPTKQDDIVAYKLACGHVIGGEDYAEYQRKVAEIKKQHFADVAALADKARQKILALADTVKVGDSE